MFLLWAPSFHIKITSIVTEFITLLRLLEEPLEEVDCFKYLGSQVAADGGCERDVVHRMNEG